MLPKSCVDVLLYVIDKLPAPLTVAAVIPLPVLPAGPVGPVGPCGPVAPRPDKFSVVPSYVKSLPDSAIVGLLATSLKFPVNATVLNSVLLFAYAFATSAKLSKFTLAPPINVLTSAST